MTLRARRPHADSRRASNRDGRLPTAGHSHSIINSFGKSLSGLMLGS